MLIQATPDVSGDLVLIIPAGVLVAIAGVVVWWLRARDSKKDS